VFGLVGISAREGNAHVTQQVHGWHRGPLLPANVLCQLCHHNGFPASPSNKSREGTYQESWQIWALCPVITHPNLETTAHIGSEETRGPVD
jgi:hypothetical protein